LKRKRNGSWVGLKSLGQNEPIDVEVLRYNLNQKGETTYITIEEVILSRAWLTVGLREFVLGRDLAIPPKLASC
jgi:hypothetical protein